ncbi:hypothetical protein F5X68DRAFT_228607 [Plectosphaerella plurivora]|uniref:Uncharacterized protein n=1 Tax=Plectosphaerella plurivora TaxID=936078 RepID=A0A9P8VHL9_9PEZI|nr:hypothetical protein F5X68DRAFT_228607 [Plectosphaerella plurivora]
MSSSDPNKDWKRFAPPAPEPMVFSSSVESRSTTPTGPAPRSHLRQPSQPAAQPLTSSSSGPQRQNLNGQRPAAQRPAAQRPTAGVPFVRPEPDSPLDVSKLTRPNDASPDSRPGPSSRSNSERRLASRSYDRNVSILDLRASIETNGNVVIALNQSHAKLVNDLNRILAELEIRLDQRTLPIAQAMVRLERLRHDMATNQYDSEMDLAQTILQEYFIVVNRLENLAQSLRSCSNKPACCACHFAAPVQGGEDFTLLDHLTGREIQEFVDMHSAKHTTESGTMRAIYQNLGSFFKDILGRFEPGKPRCDSRKGFLSAWRRMTQQQSYLDDLDRELCSIRDAAMAKRARGEHDHQKKSHRVSLSGLFKGRDKSDRGSFGSR